MPKFVSYIPIVTTLFCVIFAILIFRRYREKGKGMHLLWWCFGVIMYGVGTFTESYVSLFGWNPFIFKSWYISGALLGGLPLAQGTVYLLLKQKTANTLTSIVTPVIIIASVFIILSPIKYDLVEHYRLTGSVLGWQWTRAFSPFLNLYAVIFLVGGAILSAVRYKRSPKTYYRFLGNVCIASGAILPGIGGSFTRFGYTEVLYITEVIGISLIYLGYYFNIHNKELMENKMKHTVAATD